jgi:hypothetical protein
MGIGKIVFSYTNTTKSQKIGEELKYENQSLQEKIYARAAIDDDIWEHL